MRKISILGSCFAAGALVLLSVAFAQTVAPLSENDRTLIRRSAPVISQLGESPSPITDQTRAVRSCDELRSLHPMANASVQDAGIVSGEDGEADWCMVTVAVARPPASNVTTIWIGLPLERWNRRFLGLGGGGFQGGHPSLLAGVVPQGFAAATTDAGHAFRYNGIAVDPYGDRGQNGAGGEFALDANGRLDWEAVRIFGHVGIHEMTVVGKALTAEFYGAPPRYSYFTGCSTGGRQGQSEVQRYPEDYDGVLSGAPSVNWNHVVTAGMWPQVVMNELQPVAQCKFEAARRAAIAACDRDDGVQDGLIGELASCRFDPAALVGTQTDCGIIDVQDAEVIRRIWDGPRSADGSRLWYGLGHDASFGAVAMTSGSPLQGRPFPIFESWSRYFLRQNPHWSAENLTAPEFELLLNQAVEQYGDAFGTARSNLDAFANRGGRTIIWHGTADDIVLAQGSVHYVDSIREDMGPRQTDAFLRLYLAPGVGHCAGGDGPQPVALLNTLMNWVERGQAPRAVITENRNEDGQVTRTRPLCPYPERARYRGRGSIDDAASFVCRR